MDITDLFNGESGQQIINGIGAHTGTSAEETASVVKAAGPILLGMLHKNASTPEGASSLLGALQQHDGSVLDNLSGFLGGGGNLADGNGILGHVLGGNRNVVENHLSQQTGVSSANVSKILAMLAPIILGFLGKQSRSNNVNTGGGLGDLLGGLLGGGGSGSAGGNILSSVLGNVLGGGGSKSGGLGGLLGGLFGK